MKVSIYAASFYVNLGVINSIATDPNLAEAMDLAAHRRAHRLGRFPASASVRACAD
jgi:hypothetical protein